MWDERFTSRLAQQSLIEMGSKKKSRRKKEHLDAISAVLILQSYMRNMV
jgi:putative Holliday junction resolvase